MERVRTLSRWLPWLVLAGLVGHAIGALLVPYLAHNALQGGDHPGHLFLARFAREHLFPFATGWNDRLWLGFAQDELYPPLVHVLTGLLGGLIGDAAALKLLVATALLSLFPAGYALGRAHGLARAAAAALACLVWAVGALSSRHTGTSLAYGANLESTFSGGMIVAAAGWPLLLWSIALLARGHGEGVREGETGGAALSVPAALVLSLTLLTHLVAGLLAALYLLCRAGAALIGDRARARDLLRRYAATGLAAAFLAAFWLLPLLLRRGLISAAPIGLRWTPVEILTFAAGPVLALAAAWRARSEERARAWALFGLALALLVLLVDRAELATHAYRFLPALWLVGAVAIGLLAARIPWLSALVAAGLVVVLLPGARLALRGNPPLVLGDLPALGDHTRTFVAVGEGHAAGYQALPHAFAEATGSGVSHGISVESAALNYAVFNTTQELDRGLPIWSVYPPAAPPLDGDARQAARWLRKLRHLGFTHLLTDLRPDRLLGAAAGSVRELGEVGSYPVRVRARPDRDRFEDGRFRFVLYELPETALVAALPELPKVISPERFEEAARLLWLQSDPETVVVDESPPPDAAPAGPETTVSEPAIVRSGPNWSVTVRVAAPTAVPLLVRVPWHPNWRATADGEPIPVSRATPGLVLLYGRGEVRLAWRHRAPAWIGLALSALSAALLVAVVAARRRRRGTYPRSSAQPTAASG